MLVFMIVGNSELFLLPLEPLVSVEELVSVEDALLRSASLRYREEDKHPQMLLVLGFFFKMSEGVENLNCYL